MKDRYAHHVAFFLQQQYYSYFQAEKNDYCRANLRLPSLKNSTTSVNLLTLQNNRLYRQIYFPLKTYAPKTKPT